MRRMLVVLVAGTLALTGCAAGSPAPSPTPTKSSATRTPTPAPTATPTTEAPDAAEFTEAELIDLCIAETTPYHNDPALELYAEQARVEARTIDPSWLVYVPGKNSLTPDLASLCVIDGTPASPVFHVAIATRPWSEDELQDGIHSNERFHIDDDSAD